MHAVQRDVEHPRQPAFQHDRTHQAAHQVTHSRKARQGNQRAIIAVGVVRQLSFAFKSQFQRLGQQRRLLVSGLGARRHQLVGAWLRAGSAIAKGKNIVVTGGLQGRADHQLVDAVGFQARDVLEKPWRTNPRSPNLQTRRNHLTIFGDQAVSCDFADGGVGQHCDPELLQGFMHRPANTVRQGRQYPWARFDQGDMHVFRFDPVQAVGCQFVGGIVQFGCQFDPGCACTDNGHADLFERIALPGVGTQVMIEQLLVKFFGLLAGIEEQAVFGRA